MDVNQYLDIFIEESKEHVQCLNESLLELEKNPEDLDVINEIFRVAHTLKGMSATMGFNKMSTLTHDMENVLQSLRNKEFTVNSELMDILFNCLDALESYVNSIADTGNEGNNDYSHLIDLLGEINNKMRNNAGRHEETSSEGGQAEEIVSPTIELNQYDRNAINKAYEMGLNVYQITVVLDSGCVLKSARAFIIFQLLERYGDIIKSVPKVEDIEDENFDFNFTVVVVSKEDKQLFINEINSISEVRNVIIKEMESTPLHVRSDNTVGLSSQQNTDTASEFESEIANVSDEHAITNKKAKTGKTVRVDINRLDVLLNLVSELIIQKTRLEGLAVGEKSQAFTETIEYLERITTSLHDAVMKVRMVPIETVFNRFPRMVRDISKELGKEVNLVMSGEETELDRTVIDEIGEPLIHLLRNSIDHGIEPVEERRRLGKPDAGQIFLRAYQDGSDVVIECDDDGQGININKVKSKIIEKGLVSKELVGNLSKKDVIDYLFRPSFSTADKITDISGRGVGLDVVKHKIESLGGIVDVETEEGKGSKFIIRLPLTLAIIQALLVVVGEEKYAIQLSSINQIIKISPDEIKKVQNQEVILLRNNVIPIIRLDKVLDVPKEEKVEKKLTIVIVKKGDKLSGLLVDGIIGQQEIVQKPLGKLLSGIKIITSATILGDGNVALILDVNSIV
ncbi:MAG TPA: chemotaxis protein CheA [Clostridiaceae bacterium]|nr:chemotaxis protein CheA [Clostridiaceae bacterium]HHV99062.1 chemotaxis protein CheA [Clostridiaceae bacterium]